MVYDKILGERIGKIVASWGNSDAKRMFGDTCFLLNGYMFSGVYKDYLFLRLGEKASKDSLKLPYVKHFDITGRPMNGWVLVSMDGIDTDEKLRTWLLKAIGFAQSLPPKK